MKSLLNKITPYLVFCILIIYILNGYKIIDLPLEKLSGESQFIDLFYIIFSVTALCISVFYYLLTELKILQNKAKINLLLRAFLVLEFWYVFAVSNLYIINTFSISFWIIFLLLGFVSVSIFYSYQKEKQIPSEIITYTGKITFLVILFFYTSCCFLYFDKIKYQTGFSVLYSEVVYVPLLLSAAIFLKNSKYYFFCIIAILVSPWLFVVLFN